MTTSTQHEADTAFCLRLDCFFYELRENICRKISTKQEMRAGGWEGRARQGPELLQQQEMEPSAVQAAARSWGVSRKNLPGERRPRVSPKTRLWGRSAPKVSAPEPGQRADEHFGAELQPFFLEIPLWQCLGMKKLTFQ